MFIIVPSGAGSINEITFFCIIFSVIPLLVGILGVLFGSWLLAGIGFGIAGIMIYIGDKYSNKS